MAVHQKINVFELKKMSTDERCAILQDQQTFIENSVNNPDTIINPPPPVIISSNLTKQELAPLSRISSVLQESIVENLNDIQSESEYKRVVNDYDDVLQGSDTNS